MENIRPSAKREVQTEHVFPVKKSPQEHLKFPLQDMIPHLNL